MVPLLPPTPSPARPPQLAARVSGFRGYWSCADGKLQQEAGGTSQSGVHHHPSSRSSLLLTSLAANPDPDSSLSAPLYNKRSTKITFWFYLQPQGFKKRTELLLFIFTFLPQSPLSNMFKLSQRTPDSIPRYQGSSFHKSAKAERLCPEAESILWAFRLKKKIKQAPSPLKFCGLISCLPTERVSSGGRADPPPGLLSGRRRSRGSAPCCGSWGGRRPAAHWSRAGGEGTPSGGSCSSSSHTLPPGVESRLGTFKRKKKKCFQKYK